MALEGIAQTKSRGQRVWAVQNTAKAARQRGAQRQSAGGPVVYGFDESGMYYVPKSEVGGAWNDPNAIGAGGEGAAGDDYGGMAGGGDYRSAGVGGKSMRIDFTDPKTLMVLGAAGVGLWLVLGGGMKKKRRR